MPENSKRERPRPEKAWKVLEYLGFNHESPTPTSEVAGSITALSNSPPTDVSPSPETATVKAKVFLGPDGRPMISNLDLGQPVLIRSERFLDYLYYLYERYLGRDDIPSAPALRAVQRVLAGLALKAGCNTEDGVSTDPLLDTLLGVVEADFADHSSTIYTLPALILALQTTAVSVGYDSTDLPAGSAELSKQIRERTEALGVRKIVVTFTRTNAARYVKFSNLHSKLGPEKVKNNSSLPPEPKTTETPSESKKRNRSRVEPTPVDSDDKAA